MKIKTSELQRPALDWAVAKCLGHRVVENYGAYIRIYLPDQKQSMYTLTFCPSTDWSQGGPIIEREIDAIYRTRTSANAVTWEAMAQGDSDCTGYGPTPLIAAMRCYVSSKLGDTVEIPAELLTN